MKNNLRYRRQFLMARQSIDELSDWQLYSLEDVMIYVHPDLEITFNNDFSFTIILLGYIFDPYLPAKTNNEIISKIAESADNVEDFIFNLKKLTGRYAIIYKDESRFVILNDALGLREIYYCTENNKVMCGSQPNLINEFSSPTLGITKNTDTLNFYENEMTPVRFGRLWAGDSTLFNFVNHLLPNHYLDLENLTVNRYWPSSRLKKIDINIALDECCRFLKGALKAVTLRHKCMMAVTAGVDSRSLMAASRDLKDKIYYFINKEPPMTNDSPDIRVPSEIFKRANVPFHVHEVNQKTDVEFGSVFLNNTFFAKEFMLPTVFNVYYMEHQEKINLLGIGELGRDYYGKAPKNLDGYYLARCLKYKNSIFATAQCKKWLDKSIIAAEEYDVDIMKLFYWEIVLGNWGAVGNSESDIAIEEFDPYSSHHINELFLTAGELHLKAGLFPKMIESTWPELLDLPFNPPETKGDMLKGWLRRAGLFHYFKRLLYRYDRFRYHKEIA